MENDMDTRIIEYVGVQLLFEAVCSKHHKKSTPFNMCQYYGDKSLGSSTTSMAISGPV